MKRGAFFPRKIAFRQQMAGHGYGNDSRFAKWGRFFHTENPLHCLQSELRKYNALFFLCRIAHHALPELTHAVLSGAQWERVANAHSKQVYNPLGFANDFRDRFLAYELLQDRKKGNLLQERKKQIEW